MEQDGSRVKQILNRADIRGEITVDIGELVQRRAQRRASDILQLSAMPTCKVAASSSEQKDILSSLNMRFMNPDPMNPVAFAKVEPLDFFRGRAAEPTFPPLLAASTATLR